MSLRRGPSLVSDYAKARRIAQLSRQVEGLERESALKDRQLEGLQREIALKDQQLEGYKRESALKDQQLAWKDQQLTLKDDQLKGVEDELDGLMNSESQRIQLLEDERRQVFIDKTQAEIQAERSQRQLKHSQNRLEELERSMTEVSRGKSEVELKAERLQHRVDELERALGDLSCGKSETELKAESLQQRVDELEKDLGELQHSSNHSGTELILPNEAISPPHTAVPGHAPLRTDQPTEESATSSVTLSPQSKLLAHPEDSMTERSATTTEIKLLPYLSDILESTFTLSFPQPYPEDTLQSTNVHSLPPGISQTMEHSATIITQPKSPLPEDTSHDHLTSPGIPQTAEHPATSITPPKLLPYPQDALQLTIAQSWFRSAFDYVNVELGQDFTLTLQSWIQLERTKDWISSSKGIACKNRPKELTRWIMNGRYDRRGNEPRFDEEALVNFGKAFVTWWTSLKQSRSEPGRGGGLGKKRNEWGTLNTSGKNGWFSIVVCLKWWGMGLGEHREEAQGESWRQSLKEVHLTLNELLCFNTATNL